MRCALPIFGLLVVLVAGDCPLAAQYPGGGYPPGTYPPGSYPPGTGGMGMPMPRFPGRNKKKNQTQNDKTPLQSTAGMLRRLDDKSIVLEAQDTRIINFKRSTETKFLKNGEAIKPEFLNPGDHLLIDARQDDQSFFYAVNVNFQKEGTLEERAQASQPVQLPAQTASSGDDDRPILRRNDSPEKDPPPEKAPAPQIASAPRKEIPASAPDEDDAQRASCASPRKRD